MNSIIDNQRDILLSVEGACEHIAQAKKQV